ncbi:hypothetical protein [Xanthobacter sediminis]
MSAVLKTLTILATGVALAAPAAAASRHDGIWSVTTFAEDGRCDKNFDFKLKVKDGKVTYAGFWPVTATGGVSRLGIVRMTLVRGTRRVIATGLVEGDAASGDWTSPKPKCSGSWFAKRA